MTITLPWPPSVNHYWLARNNSHKKRISAEGRSFRIVTKVRLMHAKAIKLIGRLLVHIDAFPPDRRKRDLDNLLKAPLDAMEKGGAYENDGQIDELSIRRKAVVPGGKLVVTVAELDGPRMRRCSKETASEQNRMDRENMESGNGMYAHQ